MTAFWLLYTILVGAMVLSVIAQLWALAVQLFILFVVISLGIMIAKSVRGSITRNSNDYDDWYNHR